MVLFGSNLPTIMVSEADRHDLLVLAGGASHSAEEAEDLLFELERARVVADRDLPEQVVRMGSLVGYSLDDGTVVQTILSYPHELADGVGRVSIFSAAGTAMLGLAPGQSMGWTSRAGIAHQLGVVAVSEAVDLA